MKKLIILSVMVTFFAGNSFSQEQRIINPLSDQQDIFKFNQKDHHTSTLKEGVENHKRLDSVVEYHYQSNTDSIPFSKTEYTFNEFGQKETETKYEWDSINNYWIGDHIPFTFFWYGGKQEWKYNVKGHINSHLLYIWNDSLNKWDLSYKREYDYDSAGNITLSADYEWDWANNMWKGKGGSLMGGWWGGKIIYEYDSNGNQIMSASCLWRDETQDWKCYEKLFYSYNSDNTISHVIYFDSHSNYDNQIELSGKTLYRYNSNGRLIEWIWYGWNRNSKKWFKVEKEEYVYDIYGNTTLYANYFWGHELKDWYGDYKSESKYDQDGNPTLSVRYQWDHELNDWCQPHYETEYSYNVDGICTILNKRWNRSDSIWKFIDKVEVGYDSLDNKTMEAKYRWDEYIDDWDGRSKFMKVFDQEGNVIDEINYWWSWKLKEWIRLERFERTYDSLGHKKTSETRYTWSQHTNRWYYYYKQEFHYDKFDNLVLLTDSRGDSQEYLFDDDNDLLMYSYYTNKTELQERTFYYYQSQITHKSELVVEDINIFPNPTSGIININGLAQPAEVKIYSIQGQLMKAFIQVEDFIDVSDLSPGIYILNISSGIESIVRKIVKE